MYNPIILGFGKVGENEELAFFSQLQAAKSRFGILPSYLGLISPIEVDDSGVQKRVYEKRLNLELGVNLKNWLEADRQRDLKSIVNRFFDKDWHRDYMKEFGLDISALINLNSPDVVREAVRVSQGILEKYRRIDVRQLLVDEKVMATGTLNTISPAKKQFSPAEITKLYRILERKARDNPEVPRFRKVAQELCLVNDIYTLDALMDSSNVEIANWPIDIFADEIARLLCTNAEMLRLTSSNRLVTKFGSGIEFDFAPRDSSYLKLGSAFGDCTASIKQYYQDSREVENIFWTVIAWILDRNYQILRVFIDGVLVMKWHLVPLHVSISDQGREKIKGERAADTIRDYFFLSVDAIECTKRFRDNEDEKARAEITKLTEEQKERAFAEALSKVVEIGYRLGVDQIYVEEFSNSKFVRDRLSEFPKIYLNTQRITKIDELEDVYEMAKYLSVNTLKGKVPSQVFMELQAINTNLMPGESIIGPNKSFAVIRGCADLGLPIKSVFKV